MRQPIRVAVVLFVALVAVGGRGAAARNRGADSHFPSDSTVPIGDHRARLLRPGASGRVRVGTADLGRKPDDAAGGRAAAAGVGRVRRLPGSGPGNTGPPARAVGHCCGSPACVPLVLIARRVSPAAALIAAAIYLFAPYGIVASRAFQPDPLMTCCSLIALWLLVRDHERGTAVSLAAASAAVAIAVVVKPMSVFLVGPGGARARARAGGRAARGDRSASGLHARIRAAAGDALLRLVGRVRHARPRSDADAVRAVAARHAVFLEWMAHADPPGVRACRCSSSSLAGTVLAGERWMKALLASLWAGYAMFAVAFTYHVPTHDYYHLPFIAAAALGSGIVADRLFSALGRLMTRRARGGRCRAACARHRGRWDLQQPGRG